MIQNAPTNSWDTVILTFDISNSASAKAASAMLWRNLRMKLDPSMRGFAISVGEGAEAFKVTPATLHNRTVREILAYIILNSRAEGWIVAGKVAKPDKSPVGFPAGFHFDDYPVSQEPAISLVSSTARRLLPLLRRDA